MSLYDVFVQFMEIQEKCFHSTAFFIAISVVIAMVVIGSLVRAFKHDRS